MFTLSVFSHIYDSLNLQCLEIKALKSGTNQAESVTNFEMRHQASQNNKNPIKHLIPWQSRFAWKQERRCLVLHLWHSLPRSYHSWHRHQPSPSPITDIADTRHTARLITMHGINNRKQLVQHYLQNGPSLLTWSRVLFKPQRLEEQMCRYSSS